MAKKPATGLVHLKAAIGKCRAALLAVAVFSAAINALMLTASLYSLQVFDRVLTSRSTDTLMFLTLAAALALVALWLLEWMRGRVMVGIGTWLDAKLGPQLFHYVSVYPEAAQAQNIPPSQPMRDLVTVRTFVSGQGLFPLMDAPWSPVVLCLVFLLHPLLGWVAILGCLVLILLAVANDFSTRGKLEESSRHTLEANQFADGAVRNADATRAMGLSPHLGRRWTRNNEAALADLAAASNRGGGIGALSKLFRQVLQVGVMGLGAWLVLKGEMTAGAMIAASILAARALAPMEQAISVWRQAAQARESHARLKEFLNAVPADTAEMKFPRPEGKLTVQDLVYGHPGTREPILRGVSFALDPGDSVAILGPMGSGKTTLAKLMVGSLRPAAGSVRLDGTNVAEWSAVDRGPYIGYLPQTIDLFRGTVRDNIARMGEPDDAKVVEAARATGGHEMIAALPQMYETQIGEGGVQVSGGQRQRIGMARALYGEPAFVVLDEPNASLDQQGDQALGDLLKLLKQRKATTVVVTHRLEAIGQVDKILILRDGRVALFGPAAEIRQKLAEAARQQQAALAAQRVRMVKPESGNG